MYARYAIMAHVVHLVNRDYEAMCKDYYTLQVGGGFLVLVAGFSWWPLCCA